MAVHNKFNALLEAAFHKKHDLSSDEIMVAFTNVAPVATNSVLTDLTEIVYTGLSSRVITTTSSSQTSGTYKYVAQDLTISATGTIPTFQYVVFYNNTATNKDLICWYQADSAINMVNGSNTLIDCDGVNGLFDAV